MKRKIKNGLFIRIHLKQRELWRGNGKIKTRKTARKLRKKLKKLGVSFGQVCTDNWEALISVFQENNHKIGKKNIPLILILKK